MVAGQTLEGLIISDPNLRGGRPIIAGTGVTVRTIVGHYKLGLTPEEIASEMALELAGVYAALTYYHLNRDEIEADILADSEEVLKQEVHRQQVRDLLVAAGLGRAAAEKPASDIAPLSPERRAELAQRFSTSHPLSDVIIEEREDHQ